MNDLNRWMMRQGFERIERSDVTIFEQARRGLRGGSIRIAVGWDEITILCFTGAPGRSPVAYTIPFAAPGGVLSAPLAVLTAAILAAASN